MTIELSNLEKKIQQLSDEGKLTNTQVVFDLGVEFGRVLEKNGETNYVCQYWKNKAAEEEIKTARYKKIKSINKLLKKLVEKSIEEFIYEFGWWNISKGITSGNFEKFKQKTTRKYCIQITDVDMSTYGGDFNCGFKVVGKLSAIFKSYGVSPFFDVGIANENGEESTTLSNVSTLSNAVLNCSSKISNNLKLEKYESFLNEISKPFLFFLLKEV